jgi:hypothetical protein
MGRFKVLFGFWLIGYAIGFVAYFLLKQTALLTYLYQALLAILGNNEILMASIAGLATSFITLAIVIAWSYTSNP